MSPGKQNLAPKCLTLFLIIMSVLLLDSQIAKAQSDAADDMPERLKKLEELIEAERVRLHIPGLALAVIKDDQVILSKGFGLANLESEKPVTSETLFAIGSSTKSFTSTLVAMLVAEEKMKWDDPVTQYLPNFKMAVDTGENEITIRDLLCHRTGFTRMGLIWASGSKARNEVIQQAAAAEPYADFRESFLYNNVMYMTAGVCAGKATESNWDQLIADRIFKPLGMNSSNTSINVAQKDDRLALGYLWDKNDEQHVQLPMRNLDSIGPSGSINSNLDDMSKWIRFQLNQGKVNDRQLVAPEVRDETWTKQIEIGGGVHYGLGWMLRDWQGKKVVEHGGNIDGFATQVTLLPELNTGYVLFANVSATELQNSSISLVFDTLFGEGKSDDAMANVDTSELTGNYIANFGPFDNATMKVETADGKVTIDVPGQMAYELKAPDEDGKWYFAITDQIAIKFNRNQEDKVTSITMFQGGATPEFIREDYDPKPDLPLVESTPLLGKYQEKDGDAAIEIELRKGRLTVATGGKGTFVFAPPSEGKDKWTLRAAPAMVQLKFNRNESGKVTSVTRFQGGKETELVRTDGDEQNSLPKVEELLNKMNKAIGQFDEAAAAISLEGKATFVHQGVSGTFKQLFTADGRHQSTQDFGKMAMIVETYDGEVAINNSTIGRKQELKGSDLATAKFRGPTWVTLDWQETYTNVEITGNRKVRESPTYEVTFSGEDVADRVLYVDQESGLILRERLPIPNDMLAGLTAMVDYEDHKLIHGINFPMKWSVSNPMMGRFEHVVEKVDALETISEKTFQLPELER